jgi:hypothetical protein
VVQTHNKSDSDCSVHFKYAHICKYKYYVVANSIHLNSFNVHIDFSNCSRNLFSNLWRQHNRTKLKNRECDKIRTLSARFCYICHAFLASTEHLSLTFSAVLFEMWRCTYCFNGEYCCYKRNSLHLKFPDTLIETKAVHYTKQRQEYSATIAKGNVYRGGSRGSTTVSTLGQ